MLSRKKIKLAILNGKENEVYEQLINNLIRERYTINQELSIQRQRDSKPEEFNVYNNYVEGCKSQAKFIINEVKNSL